VAVYERRYRPYDGRRTPQASRFLILPRYGLKRLFASRMLLSYFVACHIPFLVGFAYVYIANNLGLLEAAGLSFVGGGDLELVTADTFRYVFYWQGLGMGFLLMMFVGPGQISSDTANNALPLYFSRPFSKVEYVLGKAALPAILMSTITWIPQMLLFALQAYLAEGWLADNVGIAFGLFVASWVWIAVLTLIALAISASVKRKMTATLYIFVVFFVLDGFGELIDVQLGLWAGQLLSPLTMLLRVLSSLYGGFRMENDVPTWAAWGALAAYSAISIWVLRRKLTAYEVVR
jgi:ABC-2 type transport system permease protein